MTITLLRKDCTADQVLPSCPNIFVLVAITKGLRLCVLGRGRQCLRTDVFLAGYYRWIVSLGTLPVLKTGLKRPNKILHWCPFVFEEAHYGSQSKRLFVRLFSFYGTLVDLKDLNQQGV